MVYKVTAARFDGVINSLDMVEFLPARFPRNSVLRKRIEKGGSLLI